MNTCYDPIRIHPIRGMSCKSLLETQRSVGYASSSLEQLYLVVVFLQLLHNVLSIRSSIRS
jgi:hypothetical protein